MRKFWMTISIAVLLVCAAAPAYANGSAIDQFSAVKYIRNLSDLAAQYRDHGLSLQLDGHNYEWLIFQDSCIRSNIEAELTILGRTNDNIIDDQSWLLHIDMLRGTIDQIDTITNTLSTYNFWSGEKKIVSKIMDKADEGSSVLDDLEEELGRAEERNYAAVAEYGEELWMIGNDLICLVKDLDYENWTAMYSGYLCAGEPCQNSFPACMACWDCNNNCGCGNACPSVCNATVKGKECERKCCPKCKHDKCGGKCDSGCKQKSSCGKSKCGGCNKCGH
jgi:hypothetical protein